MIPIYEIEMIHSSALPDDELSGELYHTEMGIPVPIEYWNSLPDFGEKSQTIIQLLRKHFPGQRIGLRMICSEEYEDQDTNGLITIIREVGHDKIDWQHFANTGQIKDQVNIELFVHQIDVGKPNGYNGEDQIAQTMRAFHLFSKQPLKVDLCIIYHMKALQQSGLSYIGQEEIGYHFKNPMEKTTAVLAIIKINWLV